MSGLDELYQEVILHHSRAPRNFGELTCPSHQADGHNPLCGDRIGLSLQIEDGLIRDVRFAGEGCAISTAAASLMTDALKDKTVEQAKSLFRAFLALVTGGESVQESVLPSKLAVFSGVKEFPMRVKCAMLAWRTFEAALAEGGKPTTTE